MNDASTKPTDTGVRVAAVQCAKQFPEQVRAQQQSGSGGYSSADKPSQPNAFDEFDDLVPEKPVPEWLVRADIAVRKFDEVLGIPPAKNRGEHLIKRLVQLAVVLSLAAYFYFRYGRKK